MDIDLYGGKEIKNRDRNKRCRCLRRVSCMGMERREGEIIERNVGRVYCEKDKGEEGERERELNRW